MAISAAVNAATAVPPTSSHSASSSLRENAPDALVMAAAGTAVSGAASRVADQGGLELDGSCRVGPGPAGEPDDLAGYIRSGSAISWFCG